MNTVLFIDDETAALDRLRRMVSSKQREWKCLFAESVEDALGILTTTSVDAIVSDINMPGKSGLQLLSQLRQLETFKYVPVILVTRNSDKLVRQKALELGANDFMMKPFDFLELSTRLTNCLALKSFQDQIKRQNEVLEEKVRERTRALELSHHDIIFRLAKAAELRDSDTGHHIVRVGLISFLIARQIKLGPVIQERILVTAPLHDVGKIAISDNILRKNGFLTDSEREDMKEHCEIGAKVLSEGFGDVFSQIRKGIGPADEQNVLLEMAASIARSHHEWWDGSGYPRGLKGADIPIEGRIVAIADVYDALRSRRPYKEPFTMHQSIEMMKKGSGTQFDPTVFAGFIQVLPVIERRLEKLWDHVAAVAMAA